MLQAVEQTCRGKVDDGTQCPCLRPKLKKDQKDDEPTICINCGHYDTSHPQEAIPQQHPGPSMSSSFGSIMSKYSHLLSKTVASEEDARRETNEGFRKKVITPSAPSGSASRITKVSERCSSSKAASEKVI